MAVSLVTKYIRRLYVKYIGGFYRKMGKKFNWRNALFCLAFVFVILSALWVMFTCSLVNRSVLIHIPVRLFETLIALFIFSTNFLLSLKRISFFKILETYIYRPISIRTLGFHWMNVA